jgi:hypothetical protein
MLVEVAEVRGPRSSGRERLACLCETRIVKPCGDGLMKPHDVPDGEHEDVRIEVQASIRSGERVRWQLLALRARSHRLDRLPDIGERAVSEPPSPSGPFRRSGGCRGSSELRLSRIQSRRPVSPERPRSRAAHHSPTTGRPSLRRWRSAGSWVVLLESPRGPLGIASRQPQSTRGSPARATHAPACRRRQERGGPARASRSDGRLRVASAVASTMKAHTSKPSFKASSWADL